MEKNIYTIGYSGYAVDDFINELKKYHISALIDVRSSPYSTYYTDYNRPALEKRLKQSGMFYRNYAQEFGARQENRLFYNSEGYLDFEKFAKSEQFISGVDKVCGGTDKGYKAALMCAEKNPLECHRCILISRAFSDREYNIVHLLPNGETKTQKDIETELLNEYFPDREQFSLFEAPDENELLDRAYRLKNAEIGYRQEENAG